MHFFINNRNVFAILNSFIKQMSCSEIEKVPFEYVQALLQIKAHGRPLLQRNPAPNVLSGPLDAALSPAFDCSVNEG